MSNYKERCKERMPDCFNCPYPDCIATQKDITRQDNTQKEIELERRNKNIIKLFLDGVNIEELSKRLYISSKVVQYVLTEAGINYK